MTDKKKSQDNARKVSEELERIGELIEIHFNELTGEKVGLILMVHTNEPRPITNFASNLDPETVKSTMEEFITKRFASTAPNVAYHEVQ